MTESVWADVVLSGSDNHWSLWAGVHEIPSRHVVKRHAVPPLLYLHGLSTSDFGPALEQFLGSSAGLSASTITRLTAQWQDEAKAFGQRDLSGTDYVYLWVDGASTSRSAWSRRRFVCW